MEKGIKVLRIAPREQPHEITVDSIQAMHDAVGGTVEIIPMLPLSEAAAVVMNADAARAGLPVSRLVSGVPIRGTFLIVGMNGNTIDSLTVEQRVEYTRRYTIPAGKRK